jgi:hypothetical protein
MKLSVTCSSLCDASGIASAQALKAGFGGVRPCYPPRNIAQSINERATRKPQASGF